MPSPFANVKATSVKGTWSARGSTQVHKWSFGSPYLVHTHSFADEEASRSESTGPGLEGSADTFLMLWPGSEAVSLDPSSSPEFSFDFLGGFDFLVPWNFTLVPFQFVSDDCFFFFSVLSQWSSQVSLL